MGIIQCLTTLRPLDHEFLWDCSPEWRLTTRVSRIWLCVCEVIPSPTGVPPFYRIRGHYISGSKKGQAELGPPNLGNMQLVSPACFVRRTWRLFKADACVMMAQSEGGGRSVAWCPIIRLVVDLCLYFLSDKASHIGWRGQFSVPSE
jgi:hypothetical protein